MGVAETLDAYALEVLWPKVQYPSSAMEGMATPPAGTIVSFDDRAYSTVGCDTCGPEAEYEVDVYFYRPTVEGVSREEVLLDYYKREYLGSYTYSGKFADLLSDIIAWERRGQ